MRELTFTVTENSITPSSIVNAGIKGENNATTLKFNLSTDLLNKDYELHLENAAGEIAVIDDVTATNGVITYMIPYFLTSHGGTATVNLCIKENSTVLYTYPCMLSFYPKSEDTLSAINYLGEISDALASCKSNRQAVELLKSDCETIRTGLNGYFDDADDMLDDCVAAKNDAVTAKNAAVAAKDDAITAKNDAITAKDIAVAAKDSAVSAKSDAISAKESAVSAKNDAVTAKNAAEAAQNDAVTAKNAAVAAKDDAITAKSDAITAKESAVSAKNDAVTAKNNAQTYATNAGTAATRAETALAAMGNEKTKADKEKLLCNAMSGYIDQNDESGNYAIASITNDEPSSGYSTVAFSDIDSCAILNTSDLPSGIAVGDAVRLEFKTENGIKILDKFYYLKNLKDKQDKIDPSLLAQLNNIALKADLELADVTGVYADNVAFLHENVDGFYPILAIENDFPMEGYTAAYIIDENPSGVIYAEGSLPSYFAVGTELYLKAVNSELIACKHYKNLSDKADKSELDAKTGYASQNKRGGIRIWTTDGGTVLNIATED